MGIQSILLIQIYRGVCYAIYRHLADCTVQISWKDVIWKLITHVRPGLKCFYETEHLRYCSNNKNGTQF